MTARHPWVLAATAALSLWLAGCQAVDHWVADKAVVEADHPTQKRPLLVAASPSMVSMEGGTSLVTDGLFAPLTRDALTAWLPATDARPYAVAATLDGGLGILAPGDDLVVRSDLPALEGKRQYSYRPAGLEAVDDHVVVDLVETNDQIVAISAGAGAYESDDGGHSWSRLTFTPRFGYIDGSRPLTIEGLQINEEGLLAFLVYPEGREITEARQRALFATGVTESDEAIGPLFCSGHIIHQRMECKKTPLGRQHTLLRSPEHIAGLWLMVEHPFRYETSRYDSRTWGKMFMDTGYFDFKIAGATSSVDRLAMVAEYEDSSLALWLIGAGSSTRYALISEPPVGTGPVQVALSPGTWPTSSVMARDGSVAAYDLSSVGLDVRLFYYYGPLALLFVIALVAGVRRFVIDHRIKVAWKKAHQAQVRRWQESQAVADNNTGQGG